MNIEDLILVSVDDHVIEPPHLFDGRLPAKYQDKAPRLTTRDDGTMVWLYEDQAITNVALNAVVGRPREELGYEPVSLEELRLGVYDIHSRVRDMDANGVLGAICFPSFVRFAGQLFTKFGRDRDQAAAMVRAYNDWHIDEWAGTYPGRIIPLSIPMLWDPEACADEVRRVAEKGCHAISFSASPFALGLPSIHSDHWDPVWKACVEEGTVICMHLGSSSVDPVTSPDAPVEVLHTLTPIGLYETAAEILWSPMFRKFPELRVSLTEGGIGWIPYFLERVDHLYSYTKYWSGTDMGGREPSDIFKEHVYLCFITDEVGMDNLDRMNVDNIMWECDYPHSSTTWPHGPEAAMEHVGRFSDEVIDKITHGNAMRAYHYDPFTHIPREAATVGALRARAADWDISIKSSAHLRPGYTGPRVREEGQITIGTATAGRMLAGRKGA